MGFNFNNISIGVVKQIEFDLDAAALLLNSFALPVNPSNCFFIGGYIITSGGTVPLNVGSFFVQGDNTNFIFLRVSTNVLNQDVLYVLLPGPSAVFSPQTPETYSLNWNYAAGDGRAKVIILYSEYQ